MIQELEIEFKNLLTKKEYHELFDAFNFENIEPIVQENFYFDTADMAIRQKHAALRIRTKDNSAKITLKTPQDGHLLETNETIPLKKAKSIIQKGAFTPPKSVLNQLSKEQVTVEKLQLIGSLKTKRVEKEYHGALLVLDQSWYGDTVDFELELEACDHDFGEELFYNILLNHKIPKRDTPNKIARALNYDPS